MKPPTSVFQLGRMRHLDLLALYFQLHDGRHGPEADRAGTMGRDWLVTAILQAREPRP